MHPFIQALLVLYDLHTHSYTGVVPATLVSARQVQPVASEAVRAAPLDGGEGGLDVHARPRVLRSALHTCGGRAPAAEGGDGVSGIRRQPFKYRQGARLGCKSTF